MLILALSLSITIQISKPCQVKGSVFTWAFCLSWTYFSFLTLCAYIISDLFKDILFFFSFFTERPDSINQRLVKLINRMMTTFFFFVLGCFRDQLKEKRGLPVAWLVPAAGTPPTWLTGASLWLQGSGDSKHSPVIFFLVCLEISWPSLKRGL